MILSLSGAMICGPGWTGSGPGERGGPGVTLGTGPGTLGSGAGTGGIGTGTTIGEGAGAEGTAWSKIVANCQMAASWTSPIWAKGVVEAAILSARDLTTALLHPTPATPFAQIGDVQLAAI